MRITLSCVRLDDARKFLVTQTCKVASIDFESGAVTFDVDEQPDEKQKVVASDGHKFERFRIARRPELDTFCQHCGMPESEHVA